MADLRFRFVYWLANVINRAGYALLHVGAWLERPRDVEIIELPEPPQPEPAPVTCMHPWHLHIGNSPTCPGCGFDPEDAEGGRDTLLLPAGFELDPAQVAAYEELRQATRRLPLIDIGPVGHELPEPPA